MQRYVEEGYVTGTWKQADDLTVATKEGYPNHELYAGKGKAALSNVALNAVNSGVELVETTEESTFWTGSRLAPSKKATLVKVEAKNKQNGTQGGTVKLWADCGKSNAVVVGGSNRQAVYTKPTLGGPKEATTATGDPAAMKAEIFKNWLRFERWQLKVGTPDDMAVRQQLSDAGGLEIALAAIAAAYSTAATDNDRKAIKARYNTKRDEVAEAYLQYYNGLSPDKQEGIDRMLKVNRFATPGVGQGYTTSSGGASTGKSRWNFHWGGVVAASDDKADNVVLENYAVGDPSVENTLWTFEMYGTKKDGQTFHDKHKATGQHGTTPTTMTVENH
ncbi:MAG: hypothetical protein ACRDQU_15185 [Pseudonocardiaceae bacterium]